MLPGLRRLAVLCLAAAALGPMPLLAGPTCGANLAAAIPGRPASAPSGTQFAKTIEGLDGDAREQAILEQVTSGNVPDFLRRLSAVTLVTGGGHQATTAVICVTPDYLAIGSDDDYFLAPMRLNTALAIAGQFGFVLPTRKMVDAIYSQSPVHLQPQPLPAGDAMRSTPYYAEHNRLVREQRGSFEAPLGTLTAGDKKDLVLTNRLWLMPDRVAIYGWHRPQGKAIQPLSTVHGWHYADYSHGVRLVADAAYMDGGFKRILDLLKDRASAGLFSDEGPIAESSRLIELLGRSRRNP